MLKKNNPTTLDNQPIKCMFFKRVQQKQQQEKKDRFDCAS